MKGRFYTFFTSMSLMQTALLSIQMKDDNSAANGLFRMLMGGFALVVGIYIVIYVKSNKRIVEQQIKILS